MKQLVLPDKRDEKEYRKFLNALFVELQPHAFKLTDYDEDIAYIIINNVIYKLDADYNNIRLRAKNIMKYCYASLRNSLIDYLRSAEKKYGDYFTTKTDNFWDGISDVVSDRDIANTQDLLTDLKLAIIKDFANTLDPEQQVFFELFFEKFLPNRKIATQMKIPVERIAALRKNMKLKMQNRLNNIYDHLHGDKVIVFDKKRKKINPRISNTAFTAQKVLKIYGNGKV